MAPIKITRFNPRNDMDDLLALIDDFEYRVGEIDLNAVKEQIKARNKDLKLRNSMIIAKEASKIVGAGFFSLWKDFLGKSHCIVHDVVTRKENAFKKGIEEKILRELFQYLKKTMKINKVYLFADKKGDSNLKSVFMKLGIKKGTREYYEHEL